MMVRFQKFNELLDDIPICFASHCRNPAVYKSDKHFRYGKPISFCENHLIVLENLECHYRHRRLTEKGLKLAGKTGYV